jgi:hypothetical protein
VLIAVTATAIGYGIDAGHKDLTHVFAGFYIAGCVAAVLAVRQDGIFTTIIQPPLILFCAVPGAYWLFHDGKVGNLKDLLINCGYPLIERFPLMLGTAGGVLAIGLIRWYFGNSRLTGAAVASDEDADADAPGAKSIVSGLVAKLQSLMHPETDAEDADDASARRKRTSSSSKARRTARSSRSTTRSSRTRSRHTREGLDDGAEAADRPERPRRSARRGATARDYDAGEPRRPRRRPRPDGDPDPRGQSPREGRREPRTRRNPYERPRSSRFDDFDGYEPPASPGSGRYESSRFGADERYDLYEPSYEPRRRRPAPNGAGPSHHPISQVRYRGSAGSDQAPEEPRGERRGRSRAHGRSQGRPPAESWEYDV